VFLNLSSSISLCSADSFKVHYNNYNHPTIPMVNDTINNLQPQYARAFCRRDAAISDIHASPETRERMTNRKHAIYQTEDYTTACRVQHCQTIQLVNIEDFRALFGIGLIKPEVERYVTESLEWAINSASDFFGQITVSLMMQEQATRPGMYTAVFIINATPHEQFRTGHIVDIEFQRDSVTHQTVNRLFYSNECSAIGQYFTELNLLLHLADDEEMHHMMFGCFMEEGFYSAPYSENEGEFAHECMHVWVTVFGIDDQTQSQAESEEEYGEFNGYTVPPPPPVNDFGALFRELYEEQEQEQEQPDDNNNNIISNEPVKTIV